jgi:hypothetical protein
VRAPPIWRNPVGEGAKRVITGSGMGMVLRRETASSVKVFESGAPCSTKKPKQKWPGSRKTYDRSQPAITKSYQNVSRETFWYDWRPRETYSRKAWRLSFGRDLLSGSTRGGLAGPAHHDWRPLHHTRLFWVALVLMLFAVTVYVMSNDWG